MLMQRFATKFKYFHKAYFYYTFVCVHNYDILSVCGLFVNCNGERTVNLRGMVTYAGLVNGVFLNEWDWTTGPCILICCEFCSPVRLTVLFTGS